MNIDSEPIRTNDTAIPGSTFLSKSKRGISAIFQRVSNSPLWQDPACRTSFACGALVSTASYAGAKLISSAVYDINELLAPCESVSPQTYGEVMSAGLKYGLSGGILTGLAVAAIIRRNMNFINVSEDYDHAKKQLLKMGAAIGLSFGAIAGMLYAVHLQQVHNTDDSHLACSGHPPIIIREQHFDI